MTYEYEKPLARSVSSIPNSQPRPSVNAPIEARRLSGEQRSLFDRTDDEMRAMVASANLRLASLQARIVDARHYVLTNGGDPALLAILGAPTDVVTLTGTTPSEEGS